MSRSILSYILLSTLLVACSNPTELWDLSFHKKVPKSVKFYNAQGQYISDCCNWLHFKIDSLDLNSILQNGFHQQEVDFSQWQNMVPPEAKNWWHPEKLGDSILYFEKETPQSRDIIFATPKKNEVYHVHYYN